MIAGARIITGHVMDVLQRQLAGCRFHACITSPPYFALRDYTVEPQVWGGDPTCEHQWGSVGPQHHPGQVPDTKAVHADNARGQTAGTGQFCTCGAWLGALGLEPSLNLYLDHLVGVFDRVRDVMRTDGVVWVNLGDCYAGSGYQNEESKYPDRGTRPAHPISPGLKALDCCNIPIRFALAMQAAGWYHRCSIVWAKGLSGDLPAQTWYLDDGAEEEEILSGSVMPESIFGWCWRKHRIKVEPRPDPPAGTYGAEFNQGLSRQRGHREEGALTAKWKDCPGCPKCEPNDGLVLKKGSWRPTSAYEYLLQFSLSSDYYCDAESIREEAGGNTHPRGGNIAPKGDLAPDNARGRSEFQQAVSETVASRNPRSVWVIGAKGFPEAHFATFPEALVEPLVKVSTPEHGVCHRCGAPYARILGDPVVVEGRGSGNKQRRFEQNRDGEGGIGHSIPWDPTACRTLGWRQTCACAQSPVPATVLDPFVGSGTTCLVARKLGRHSVGIELSARYAKMAQRRIGEYAPLFQ